MSITDSLIKAEKEGAVWVDYMPKKALRPIGTAFKEWNECLGSTDLPHWMTWKVVGYLKSFVSRSGGTLFYERHEEIQLV